MESDTEETPKSPPQTPSPASQTSSATSESPKTPDAQDTSAPNIFKCTICEADYKLAEKEVKDNDDLVVPPLNDDSYFTFKCASCSSTNQHEILYTTANTLYVHQPNLHAQFSRSQVHYHDSTLELGAEGGKQILFVQRRYSSIY